MNLYEVSYRKWGCPNNKPTMRYIIQASSQWEALLMATKYRSNTAAVDMTWYSITNLDTEETVYLVQVRSGTHLTGMYKREQNEKG